MKKPLNINWVILLPRIIFLFYCFLKNKNTKKFLNIILVIFLEATKSFYYNKNIKRLIYPNQYDNDYWILVKISSYSQ